MSHVAIEAEGLSKRYRIGELKRTRNRTLGSAIVSSVAKPIRNLKNLRSLSTFSDKNESNVVWALKDASFQLREGEALGVIGRNGSGKSTLLKVLSKITEPSAGSARIRGRVSSLLEVGTGFHPQLTGRENTYLNGAILGMSKGEIARKFDEIVEFSGIGRFIDTPVKHYSTGMKVRLAFAVAAHLEPEILLIDEVLAVGDAEFQQKCLGRMNEVAGGGRTVMFVSHNMGAVMTLCDRAIVLDEGEIEYDGDSATAVDHYREINSLSATGRLDQPGYFRNKGNLLSLESAEVTSNGAFNPNGYFTGAPLEFNVGLRANTRVEQVRVGIGIKSIFGERIATVHSSNNGSGAPNPAGGPGLMEFTCNLGQSYLAPGVYSIQLQIECDQGGFTADPAFTFEILQRDQGRKVRGGLKDGLLHLPAEWTLPVSSEQSLIATR